MDNAIALLVGRTWNYAIVGALSYYNTLTDDSTPIVLYAVGATTAALFLNRRIARGLRTGCEEKLAKQVTTHLLAYWLAGSLARSSLHVTRLPLTLPTPSAFISMFHPCFLQPTLDRVEAMSPTESKRDVLTPMLRQPPTSAR